MGLKCVSTEGLVYRAGYASLTDDCFLNRLRANVQISNYFCNEFAG